MLQVSDVRETRVFQEALEEGLEKGHKAGLEEGFEQGIEKGIEKGIEEGIETVATRMLRRNLPLEEIVAATGLKAARTRKLKKKLTE
ncbi:MAG TPA: hypothetical protein VGL71_03950 [Urbifossiella sp.]